MSLLAIEWQMIGGITAIVVFFYTFLRNFKNDMKQNINLISDQVNELRSDLQDFRDETHNSLSDVKERLSFLEAAALYTMPLEPAQLNPRSQAAREMWKKRKQKGLEKKDG